jgi:hypothetical protein
MQKEIRGTRPDSGLMIGSKKIMEEYRLEEAGYQLATGSTSTPGTHCSAFRCRSSP